MGAKQIRCRAVAEWMPASPPATAHLDFETSFEYTARNDCDPNDAVAIAVLRLRCRGTPRGVRDCPSSRARRFSNGTSGALARYTSRWRFRRPLRSAAPHLSQKETLPRSRLAALCGVQRGRLAIARLIVARCARVDAVALPLRSAAQALTELQDLHAQGCSRGARREAAYAAKRRLAAALALPGRLPAPRQCVGLADVCSFGLR